MVLKDPINGAWRETGRLFHSDGTATANARRPNELDVRWVTQSPLADERRLDLHSTFVHGVTEDDM